MVDLVGVDLVGSSRRGWQMMSMSRACLWFPRERSSLQRQGNAISGRGERSMLEYWKFECSAMWDR